MNTLLQQINFYILTTDDYSSFACRLLEKAYQSHQKIYVVTENASKAERLNHLLWTFRDISFVPHHLQSEPDNQSTPICISYTGLACSNEVYYDALLLLTPTLPENYLKFPRLLLTIPDHLDWKIEGRKHYKTLTQAGYQIETHQLR